MKRSTQVTLVLTAVAGLGAGAYALAQNSGCRQSGAPAAPGDAAQSCQSSHGGGHSSGHGFFHSSAGTTSAGSSGESSTGGATSHGGFGATGHGTAGGE
jgi:hypothetical protein